MVGWRNNGAGKMDGWARSSNQFCSQKPQLRHPVFYFFACLYTRFARAVANAWMGVNGAWKSSIKLPFSILPNCNTWEKTKRETWSIFSLVRKWGWNSKHYNCISTSHNQFQYNNQTMSFPRETQLQEWPTSTVHRVCQLARMPETLARPHSSWSKTTVLD